MPQYLLKCSKCGEDVERGVFTPNPTCFKCRRKRVNSWKRTKPRRQRAKKKWRPSYAEDHLEEIRRCKCKVYWPEGVQVDYGCPVHPCEN